MSMSTSIMVSDRTKGSSSKFPALTNEGGCAVLSARVLFWVGYIIILCKHDFARTYAKIAA